MILGCLLPVRTGNYNQSFWSMLRMALENPFASAKAQRWSVSNEAYGETSICGAGHLGAVFWQPVEGRPLKSQAAAQKRARNPAFTASRWRRLGSGMLVPTLVPHATETLPPPVSGDLPPFPPVTTPILPHLHFVQVVQSFTLCSIAPK